MTDRVISLAPSATSVVHHLGGEQRLIEGDFGGWLTPDLDAVIELEPDLVLTTDALQRPIADQLEERGIRTAHFDPRTLPEVYEYIRDVGEVIGMAEEGASCAAEAERAIDAVRCSVREQERPVVYCEEWNSPPMVAGNWVPEIVEAAGGEYPFCEPGERSREIDEAEIEAACPTCAIVHLCGMGTAVDRAAYQERDWSVDRVHILDDRLLNQPSPHLVEATERIARIVHPEISR